MVPVESPAAAALVAGAIAVYASEAAVVAEAVSVVAD